MDGEETFSCGATFPGVARFRGVWFRTACFPATFVFPGRETAFPARRLIDADGAAFSFLDERPETALAVFFPDFPAILYSASQLDDR